MSPIWTGSVCTFARTGSFWIIFTGTGSDESSPSLHGFRKSRHCFTKILGGRTCSISTLRSFYPDFLLWNRFPSPNFLGSCPTAKDANFAAHGDFPKCRRGWSLTGLPDLTSHSVLPPSHLQHLSLEKSGNSTG